MERFFLPPELLAGADVGHAFVFPADQSRQMQQVLRLPDGAVVEVCDGKGRCYEVVITHLGKNRTGGRILKTMPASTPLRGEPTGDIILCQALLRQDRFEWVLQKGTELGVTHFQPILTQRTVRREVGPALWQRWQRIVREAAEQSGRTRLPTLASPLPFEAALTAGRGLVLLATPGAPQTPAVLPGLARWPATLVIGPEGGLTPDEIARAQQLGIAVIGLGPRILRAETAALVLLTLVTAALGEFERLS
jgi:16S rRNA (uracil1498-N3)-methyltransferase